MNETNLVIFFGYKIIKVRMEWYFMCTFQEAAFLLKSCWSSKTQLPHVTIISSSTTPLFLYLFNSLPFLILFILILFVTFPRLLFFFFNLFFNLVFSHSASVTLSYVFNFSFYLCFSSPTMRSSTAFILIFFFLFFCQML